MIRALLTITLLIAIAAAPLGAQPRRDEPDAWRSLAASLPAGAQVSLRLKDGRRFTGTIVEVSAERILFKPKTRVPIPAGDVAFAEIDSLHVRNPGLSPGAKVAIGTGTAVGVVLLIGLLLTATLD
jgi:hypothetical protein